VSAGVLKIFRSSDKKGTQGIEYGVEWYPKLMERLESASDVVCLLTEHSLGRPWILYEAGVAKGKLNTPLYGIALGIPLNRANSGPFAQFQNCDDNEESLTKLVMQLISRIPGSEPDHDAVMMQVRIFKDSVKKSLEKLGRQSEEESQKSEGETSVSKLFEEIKVMFQDLPTRIEQTAIRPSRRRWRLRRHPMEVMDTMRHLEMEPTDPVSILILSSMLRDDMPWLYEVGMETYRAMKSRNAERVETAIMNFRRMVEFTMRGPLREELEIDPSELGAIMDFLQQLRAMIHHRLRSPSARDLSQERMDVTR
jgi:hypothetical protein